MDDFEVDDSSTLLVLCEATKNSAEEDEYKEAGCGKQMNMWH